MKISYNKFYVASEGCLVPKPQLNELLTKLTYCIEIRNGQENSTPTCDGKQKQKQPFQLA